VQPPYLDREPAVALRGVVQRLWWLRMPSPQRFERIVPQPAVHLILNLADEPYRVIARGREPVGDTLRAGFVSGVQLEYLLNENPASIHHVGAALQPWALRAFGVDPAAVAQRVQDAEPLFPGIGALRGRLAAADPHDAISALESLLVQQLAAAWRPDPRIVEAVGGMLADPGRPMHELAAASGLTPKGFSAAFRRECGVTPKRFAEVCRHQAFLAGLPAEGELPRWSDLLGHGRYYDQPHFIAEFRRFTGMTPTAYLEHRRRFGHGDPSFLPMDEELLERALAEQRRG
jgi:AraC-like DNA-binding protein